MTLPKRKGYYVDHIYSKKNLLGNYNEFELFWIHKLNDQIEKNYPSIYIIKQNVKLAYCVAWLKRFYVKLLRKIYFESISKKGNYHLNQLFIHSTITNILKCVENFKNKMD